MVPRKLLGKASILLLGAIAMFILIHDEISMPLLYNSLRDDDGVHLNSRPDGVSRRLDNPHPAAAPVRRRLSIDLGNGECEWTDAIPAGVDADIYGTLFASYPGSGMRVSWQHMEGIVGYQVGDDFMLGGNGVQDKTGLQKTQYPHIEGIWSWGAKMDQVVLLVRNPRWAMPSYHSFLYEIYYAHDWETAYLYFMRAYTSRPPLENWIKWRDYRFSDEIDMWCWYIDYWMEGGTQYWMDYDFERNGQWPFRYLTQEERYARSKDLHCIYELDCVPKAIMMYEKLVNYTAALPELTKVADLLRGKKGMDLIVSDEAIPCVYNLTWRNAKLPFNNNRDNHGPGADQYGFTNSQLETILEKLQMMIDKYGSGEWATNPQAQELVSAFNLYHAETSDELETQRNMVFPPTKAPTEEYKEELISWYSSLGRGNRYDKSKVQKMFSIWPQVKHLYETGDMDELDD